MQIIKKLSRMIEDELSDARKYIKCAMEQKEANPDQGIHGQWRRKPMPEDEHEAPLSGQDAFDIRPCGKDIQKKDDADRRCYHRL